MRTPLIVKSLALVWTSNSFVKFKNFNTNEDKNYSSSHQKTFIGLLPNQRTIVF
jgi:hypothetical protein